MDWATIGTAVLEMDWATIATAVLGSGIAAVIVSKFGDLAIQRYGRKVAEELAARDKRTRTEFATVEYFRTHQRAAVEARNAEFFKTLKRVESAARLMGAAVRGESLDAPMRSDLNEARMALAQRPTFWESFYPQQLKEPLDTFVRQLQDATVTENNLSVDQIETTRDAIRNQMHSIMGTHILLGGTILDDIGRLLEAREARDRQAVQAVHEKAELQRQRDVARLGLWWAVVAAAVAVALAVAFKAGLL